MPQLNSENIDKALSSSGDALVAIFFWGHNCPNCEVAKRILLEEAEKVQALGIRWFHVNTYEDLDLGTRFGLHGIPTFLFFRKEKRLGKITPFPGIEAFLAAMTDLKIKQNLL